MFNREIIFHLKRIGTEKHTWTSGFYRYEHIYSSEGRDFKTSLKENYAIGLDSCHLFTKKVLNMQLNTMF